ncbi:magnesium transporter [Ferrimonas balearica]|uniref:magnesium transporter n=1 Tax=Ferrimonas balearica TaxID=44012 RepID=UPI001C9A01C8|nr:magnesium transporter [Ferrimonas balearica]MBY5991011.1 magnesium transporter [Ferrimonas balearica]
MAAEPQHWPQDDAAHRALASNWIEPLNLAEGEQQLVVFLEALEQLEASELGLLLESLPLAQRRALWPALPTEDRVEALVAMRVEARDSILSQLDESEMAALLGELDAESLIELSDNLSDKLVDQALGRMDTQQQAWYRASQEYDEDQIGRYLDHEVVVLPPNVKVAAALRMLRRYRSAFTDRAYVVDRHGVWLGEVTLTDLLQADASLSVRHCIDKAVAPLSADTPLLEAAERMEHSDLPMLPVVDEAGRLLGRMTLRLAMEIVREHYEGQLMASAGLNEEADLFLPVWHSAKRRALWLGINLLTALLAAWTIGLFEATLSQVVALAVLMPIVASMGGIAGSQTLTLIIRGLALGQVTAGNALDLCRKEIGVAVLNGLVWAAVIGVVATLWFGSVPLGGVMAAAIVINILAAALAGVAIPLVLDRLAIDPALSGSVILTTVTDVVGFFTFLGLGTLFLLT